MKRRSAYYISLFCSVLILLSVTTGYGVGTAHAAGENIGMELDIPTSVTAGEAVEISASADVPDVFPLKDPSTELTVTLFVNGEKQGEQVVEVTDGETISVSFEETFDTSGETDIRVEASLSHDLLDSPVEGEVQGTIDVDPEPLGDLSIDVSGPSSITQGDTASYDVTVSLPDAAGRDDAGDITLELIVDDETLDSRTVQLGDGDSLAEGLSATFDGSGSKELTFKASGSIAGTDLSVSRTRELSIEKVSLDDLQLDVDVPTEATVDEETRVSGSVTLPESDALDVSGDLTVRVEADGDTVGTKTITLSDGDTESFDLGVTLDQDGETDVTATVTGSIEGYSLKVSRTRTVDVRRPTEIVGELGISADVPSSVDAGSEVTVGTTVDTPDVSGDVGTLDVTVEVLVDGEREVTRQVEIGPGDSNDVEVDVTLDREGSHTVTVVARTTVLDKELEKSVSKTVDVDALTVGTIGLDVTAPEEATVDSETAFDIAVDGNKLPVDAPTEVTLKIVADDETVATGTVDLSGDDSQSKDLTAVFTQEGETTVEVIATASVAGKSVSKSITREINVTTDIVQVGRHQGVSIPVPDSMEDEVAQYRAESGLDGDVRAFLLATEENRYLVLTNETPTEGAAVVNGFAADQSARLNGMTFGLIVAKSVTFTTEGESVGIQELNEDPATYRLTLVRVDATYQRVATLTDPDGEDEMTAASTVGRLVSDPRTAAGVLQNLGAKAGKVAEAESAEDAATVLPNSQSPSVATFSFETRMWADAPAQVDAVVVSPGTTAYETLAMLGPTEMPSSGEGRPLLYVVDSDFGETEVDSVAEVKQQASDLDGEVVTLNARLYQQRYSTQETLEHSTGCDETVMQIQTPQGPACVNLVQDVLLHGGVAWSEVPQSRDDVLFVLGASAFHQDEPQTFEEGRYRIVGEVVSTDRIDEDLPDGSILLVYDLERTGDIDYDAVQAEARTIIENRTAQVIDRVRAGVESRKTGKANETIDAVSPGGPAAVQFSKEAREKTGIEQLSIQSAENAEEVSVSVTTIRSLPEDAPTLPDRAVKTMDISVGLDDESIEGATFELTLTKDVDYDGGELTVYRLHDGEWQALETSVAAESESEITLTVETPGFSYFSVRETVPDSSSETDQGEAVGTEGGQSSDSSPQEAAESSTDGTSGVTETSTPGFSIPLVIFSVALSAILFIRRRR